MDLELRHLRTVCAIAECGSVTKASARLGLAQPALTAQLGRIERILGGPLFDRDYRGARLTPLGELVLARARVVLPAVEDLQHEARRHTSGSGTVIRYRIGSVGNSMISGLVRRLSEEQPDTDITTQASWSADDLVNQVTAGKLDFAIIGCCGEAAAPGGLEWRLIAVDTVGVLLPEEHPLAGGDEVELADLASSRWAAAPGDGCFGECFAAACARAGFTPETIYETDLRVCLDLVHNGQAVALCQPTFREIPGVKAIPLAGAPLRWRHLIGWDPLARTNSVVDQVHRHAMGAYDDSLRFAPDYAKWLAAHPRFGTAAATPALPPARPLPVATPGSVRVSAGQTP